MAPSAACVPLACMVHSVLQRLLLGVILLAWAGGAFGSGADDRVRSKAEEFIGQPIEAVFCEPIEQERGARIDHDTCAHLSRKSLETCWGEYTSLFPNLQKPVSEYASWMTEDELQQLRQSIRSCIRSGSFLGQADQLLHWELLSGRVDEANRVTEAAGWVSAVELAVAPQTQNRQTIVGLVEAFLSTDYLSVHLPVDRLVLGTVDSGGELVTSPLDTPPDWVTSMKSLGFNAVDRHSSSVRMVGEPGIVTDEHEFVIQLLFQDAYDLPDCKAKFASIDCGVCIGAKNDDFVVLVTWLSKQRMGGLIEEPSDGEDLVGQRVTQCVEEGIRRVREL